MIEMVEVEKATCTLCGEEKECIKFKYEGRFLWVFPKEEELSVCETCLSRAFRLLRKDR